MVVYPAEVMEVSTASAPNIFGVYPYLLKFSPFNCEKSNPLRFVFMIFSFITFLAMVFRAGYMLFYLDVKALTLGFAEQNLYGFISMESFCLVIALFKITKVGRLRKVEQKLAEMREMRITSFHESHDKYWKLWIELFIFNSFNLVLFIGTAIYLLCNRVIIVGTKTKSSWYYYFDAPVMILCAYANFLHLPIHELIHTAFAREFRVFNDELENASKNKELLNPQTFQRFADRQIKMFECINPLTERMNRLMAFAPLFILTALTNVLYLVTNLRSATHTLYFICMVGMLISCIIISKILLYPPALVQEAMLHTSTVLMNDQFIHHSKDPQIYSIYRTMVDRSMHNRSVNVVIRIFDVNRKNIERAYFIISNIVLVMVVFSAF